MVQEWESQQRPGGLICTAGSCSACSNPDPLTDTVRIGAPLTAQGEEGRQRLEEIAVQWREGDRAEGVQREVELETQWRAGDEARQLLEEEAERKERLKAEEEARHAETKRVAEEARKARELEELAAAEAEQQAAQAELEQRRRAQISVFLKEHGFTNGVNGFKKTCMKKKYPIHSAAKRGDPEIIEMLIQARADVSEKDSRGKTALEIARKKNLTGAIQVLIGAAS